MYQLKVLYNYDILAGHLLGMGPPMITEVSVTLSVLFQGSRLLPTCFSGFISISSYICRICST